jgi:hypothetical protein
LRHRSLWFVTSQVELTELSCLLCTPINSLGRLGQGGCAHRHQYRVPLHVERETGGIVHLGGGLTTGQRVQAGRISGQQTRQQWLYHAVRLPRGEGMLSRQCVCCCCCVVYVLYLCCLSRCVAVYFFFSFGHSLTCVYFLFFYHVICVPGWSGGGGECVRSRLDALVCEPR